MPNSWFQFKQFRVLQDRCAMKVSTDACIQGAWAAFVLQQQLLPSPVRMLDIGTGTGLLSLMLAQALPGAYTDAIELNPDAYEQAADNFASSPWDIRLKAIHVSLAGFAGEAKPDYDLIICNPPFFHNQLQAPGAARNDARHSVALRKEMLAVSVKQLLKQDGYCCVMYPASEWPDWLAIALQQGLHAVKTLEVRPRATQAVNRVIGMFQKQEIEEAETELLTIYREDGSYTDRFSGLLKDYYLKL